MRISRLVDFRRIEVADEQDRTVDRCEPLGNLYCLCRLLQLVTHGTKRRLSLRHRSRSSRPAPSRVAEVGKRNRCTSRPGDGDTSAVARTITDRHELGNVVFTDVHTFESRRFAKEVNTTLLDLLQYHDARRGPLRASISPRRRARSSVAPLRFHVATRNVAFGTATEPAELTATPTTPLFGTIEGLRGSTVADEVPVIVSGPGELEGARCRRRRSPPLRNANSESSAPTIGAGWCRASCLVAN